jgi:hypothetical protein
MTLKTIYHSDFERWLKQMPCSYKSKSNEIKLRKAFEAGKQLGQLQLLEKMEKKQ